MESTQLFEEERWKNYDENCLELRKRKVESNNKKVIRRNKATDKKEVQELRENLFYNLSNVPENICKKAVEFLYRYLAGKEIPYVIDVILISKDKKQNKYSVIFYNRNMTKILYKIQIYVDVLKKGKEKWNSL